METNNGTAMTAFTPTQRAATRAIRNALGTHVDSCASKQNGNVIVRRTFFYRHGVDAAMFRDHVVGCLTKADVKATVIDFGEHWAPFNGGARISRDSHWWVELKPAA
jgi:hypothetical protein